MELAVIEKSAYLPPILVGALFLYRSLYGGIMNEHPITKSYTVLSSSIQFVSNEVLQNLFQFVNATQAKALAIKHTSLSAMNMVAVNIHRMVTMVIQNVNLLVAAILNSLYATLSTIRFHFTTVIQQTYNSTSNMFTALKEKTSGVEMFFANIRAFFLPPQKNTFEYIYIGALITVAFLVVAATVYYLSKQRVKTVELPASIEEEPVFEPVKPLRKNPVRRKAKVN